MKKLVLAVLFLGGMTAHANTVTNLDHIANRGIRYNEPQSITFVERGVEFVVFVNGEFDFAPLRGHANRNYGRRGNSSNAPGHTYGVSYRYGNRGFIKYDRFGDVYKVGRNFLNYNRRGQVNQIGSVSLRYRNGRLTRVGNMQLIYNRRGIVVDLIGYVHHDVNFYRNRTFRNRIDLNDGYMTQGEYYRNNKEWYGKKGKKNKKIKKHKNRRFDD